MMKLMDRKEELAERRKMIARHPDIHGIDFVSLEADDTVFVHFITPHDSQTEKKIPELSRADYHFTLYVNGRSEQPEVHLEYDHQNNILILKLGKPLNPAENSSISINIHHELIDRFFSQAEYVLTELFRKRNSLTEEVTEQYSFKETPRLDYLSKDYDSFKTLIENELSFNSPDWKERNPADIMVMISEVLAYSGDYLSYEQDSVATEAYLSTARLDRSIKRHSRLLDYTVKQRVNSRTWVQVCVKVDTMIPKGTQLFCGIDNAENITLREKEYRNRTGGKEIVYETMYGLSAVEAFNEMSLYNWGVRACIMKKGAVETSLEGKVPLKEGDVIIFSSISGRNERQAVRLKENALFHTDRLTGKTYTSVKWHNEDAMNNEWLSSDCRVLGNIVMADRGETIFYEKLHVGCKFETFYSLLQYSNLIYTDPYNHSAEIHKPASVSFSQNVYHANPSITIFESALGPEDAEISKSDTAFELNSLPWIPVGDFLASTPYSRHVVIEEEAGRTYIRFGDGVYSAIPSEWNNYFAKYRITPDSTAKIAVESINQIYLGEFDDAVTSVTNLVPAFGDQEVESNDFIKKMAPILHKIRKNLAIPDDYVNKLKTFSDVRDAYFEKGWSGTREIFDIYVYPYGEMSQLRLESISLSLAIHKIISHRYSLFFYSPLYLHILVDIKTDGHVSENFVLQKLRARFLDNYYDDHTTGLFNPDNFTFNTGLYKSVLIKAALDIKGVESASLASFQKLDDFIGSGEKIKVQESIFPEGPEIITLKKPDRCSLVQFSINGGDYV